jgi:hypothetical protein
MLMSQERNLYWLLEILALRCQSFQEVGTGNLGPSLGEEASDGERRTVGG